MKLCERTRGKKGTSRELLHWYRAEALRRERRCTVALCTRNRTALESHRQHDRVCTAVLFFLFFSLFFSPFFSPLCRHHRHHHHHHHHYHHRLCRLRASATICSSSPRPQIIEFITFIPLSFYTFFFLSFSHSLFVVNVVLTWLFSFFFWFCCCVGVVCEAGA